MRTGVFGLGRFGTFWAQILAASFGEVCAYNRSPRETIAGIKLVGIAELARCDSIFLCCTISSIPDACKELAPLLNPNTVLLDTCSVKVWPLQQMARHLPKSTSIIGTHPMFGPDSGRNGVNGLPIALCSFRESNEQFQEWQTYFKRLGLSVNTMSAEEHDAQAAITQGVTHYFGRLFSELELKQSPIATLGYKKLLEVMEQTCNDPWQLFVDLQNHNPYSQKMRDQVTQAAQRINALLDAAKSDQ